MSRVRVGRLGGTRRIAARALWGVITLSNSENERPLAGHRVLPHTADVALAAWAPTRAECIAEAVRALVESFVEVARATPREGITFPVEAETDDDLLVAILDEVIYQLEVHDRVAVDAEVAENNDGGAVVYFGTVSTDDVDLVGAVPKAVSLHELRFGQANGTWRCHVTVDV